MESHYAESTKHKCRSISTNTIHTTWHTTRGSYGQHQVLRPVHVIINDCGQTEQAELTSVHFTPVWHGSRLGLQRAACHPSAHQLLGFLVLVFETNPLEGPTWAVCSHLLRRSDRGLCSHRASFNDPFFPFYFYWLRKLWRSEKCVVTRCSGHWRLLLLFVK